MDKPPPTPYPALNSVLQDLVASIRAVLGENFTGAYLQGSFAVGDFDRHSDVDFIVACEHDLTPEQVAALQAVHGRIFALDIPWAQHLEGSYFPRDVLRDAARAGEPLWYLDHGSRALIQSNHCNTILVRCVVRDYGVALAGPDPAALVDPIPVAVLRQDIAQTIHDWGREILGNPERFNNRFYQGYLVLNYSRMLHDLVRGKPGSKRAGAEWAKANLDPTWHGLIDRTWDCRPDPAVSVRQRPDPDDFRATLAFIQVVMNEATIYIGMHGLGWARGTSGDDI
ncbi:MAG: DUF4111 domain-containing protein [Chloroflexi bacterium]|nr:DUF4111 domain-containing protein [Chloroflexota bacterium]